MRANLFKAAIAGMLAVGMVTVLGAMVSKEESSGSPVGIKSDRLAVAEYKAGCPQIAWPYGCDWQETTSSKLTKHHGAATRGR
jgi:hypothetical protein